MVDSEVREPNPPELAAGRLCDHAALGVHLELPEI
jgi:hypothetical protein